MKINRANKLNFQMKAQLQTKSNSKPTNVQKQIFPCYGRNPYHQKHLRNCIKKKLDKKYIEYNIEKFVIGYVDLRQINLLYVQLRSLPRIFITRIQNIQKFVHCIKFLSDIQDTDEESNNI